MTVQGRQQQYCQDKHLYGGARQLPETQTHQLIWLGKTSKQDQNRALKIFAKKIDYAVSFRTFTRSQVSSNTRKFFVVQSLSWGVKLWMKEFSYFIYTKSLQPPVKTQVLLQHSELLAKTEQLTKRADVALML